MSSDSPEHAVRPPHPLTLELIDRLRARPHATVLEVGAGSGRNTHALHAAGFRVVCLDDAATAAAALSTHALLHGTPASISELLHRIAEHVEGGAPLYATFGSVRDRRYGRGRLIEERVYAPQDGDERDVPGHAQAVATRRRSWTYPTKHSFVAASPGSR